MLIMAYLKARQYIGSIYITNFDRTVRVIHYNVNAKSLGIFLHSIKLNEKT